MPRALLFLVSVWSGAVALRAPQRLGVIPATQTRPAQGTDVGSSRAAGVANDRRGNFEWAVDPDARRGDGDAFHVLLLNETFAKPRMTVPYAAGALCLVLAMAEADALEHSAFAMAQGFSCLGSWRRDECLEYCDQLAARDLVVRAVPGVRGKQAWQGAPSNAAPDALSPGRP